MVAHCHDHGQHLDATGLLFYNARYYDPGIGRFVSGDTVVPGNASGGMDGVAVKPLTVSFHEGGFLSKLNTESKLGFWFQLSDKQREQAGSPWGPSNPQALNRYSYVQNNPLKYTDPTGHEIVHQSKGWNAGMLDAWDAEIDNWMFAAGIACMTIVGCIIAGPLATELQFGVKGAINEARRIAAERGGTTFDIEIGRGAIDGYLKITIYDDKGNVIAIIEQRLYLTTSIALETGMKQGNWESFVRD